MSGFRLSLRFVGVGPMLMHSSRLADPLDPQTRALAAVTSKRGKVDADHLRIAELEWHAGLWLSEGSPCLPPQAIESAFVQAARTRNKGKIARAALTADGPAPLEYCGPRSITDLWRDERFRHRAMVRVGTSLTARTRPRFPDWSARVAVTFLPGLIDRADVMEFFGIAGALGIGDYRPRYGRFVVEATEPVD